MPDEKEGTALDTTAEAPVPEWELDRDYSDLNVYQKYRLVRRWARQAQFQKTGKNPSQRYFYFELEDIVPLAETFCDRAGLVLVIRNIGNSNSWSAELVDVDRPNDYPNGHITFGGVYATPDPIKNRDGKDITNKCQTIGSGITYFRRYIWMIVLDLIEPDQIDAAPAPAEKPAQNVKVQPVSKPQAPATTSERKSAAKAITSGAEAPAILLKSLQESMKRCLRDTNKSETAVKLAAKAKEMTDGFTKGSQKDVQTLIAAANKLSRQAKEAA